MYPIENRRSNTEKLKDAEPNLDEAIATAVATTPSNALINHEKYNLEEHKSVQTPKQSVDRMETGRTYVHFGRVDYATLSADEWV